MSRLFIPRKDYFRSGDDSSKSEAEMANYLAIERWANDLETFASGDIIISGSATRSGFLKCNGASYLRSDYPGLFDAIGTTYGSVDGTHFNVPNLVDFSPMGAGGLVALGGTLTYTHTHDVNSFSTGGVNANHTHLGGNGGGVATTGQSADHGHTIGAHTTTGASSTLSRLGVNFFIKT